MPVPARAAGPVVVHVPAARHVRVARVAADVPVADAARRVAIAEAAAY